MSDRERRLKPRTWSCVNRSSSCGGQRQSDCVSMRSRSIDTCDLSPLQPSALRDPGENEATCTAELTRKFAQAQSLAANAQPIELHQPGFVEIDRNAGPERINVVG